MTRRVLQDFERIDSFPYKQGGTGLSVACLTHRPRRLAYQAPPSISFPAVKCWVDSWLLRQCQRYWLLHNLHASLFSYSQSNAQNSPVSLTWCVNRELPDISWRHEKGRGTRITLPTSGLVWRKTKSLEKTNLLALLIVPMPLTVWIQQAWKILKKDGQPDHSRVCLLKV